jgi:hypothetical protein
LSVTFSFGRKRGPLADLIRLFNKWIFEVTLPAKIDKAEQDYFDKAPIPQAPDPIIIEEEINTETQTGESQKLGGPIQISAPWYEREKQ